MKNVIIACDFEHKETLRGFLRLFGSKRPMLKIGMELFYREGPELIRQLKRQGYPLFLDLKLHDIPHTVEKAMVNIGHLGVDMVNVHASGGLDMMEAAKYGLKRSGSTTKLLAVTVLTSIDEAILANELLVHKPLEDTVKHFALLAKKAGLDGVVCSPLEVPIIKKVCSHDFLTVTPGIRYPSQAQDDQRRITTPSEAKKLGTDLIVVGRTITKAVDPYAMYDQIVREFTDGA
ncbi:MAG: orotidine-5'-phosphate decarboxylase [Candidatus Izemoplasmatales bacterium]|jgi:orotidine-5'-phosphate decarboxylase|nr:orotidine-5'-phosphate decarboxylase [Candidatus Izemoplasmatales bacterium]MDD4355001.1 orotidine-5'-phosphate decarboxylase [Candidatus Izemoplasmatales bacterium]MDD4987831.1 orotidine-5'-phosphate decarboxylase [Candidatus Izemoplasmatales bacterium]